MKLLGALMLVLLVGCRFPQTEDWRVPAADLKQGANGIGLFLRRYVGVFGDNEPTWAGQFYRSQNLSIVAHLPTRSEFIVCVRKGPAGVTNTEEALKSISLQFRNRASATTNHNEWKILVQKIAQKKKSLLLNVNYLRSEFVGLRVDTDRYSKSEQVVTFVYVGCLTPDKPASQSLYSVTVAMIPTNVSTIERERLVKLLEDFMQNKSTYFL